MHSVELALCPSASTFSAGLGAVCNTAGMIGEEKTRATGDMWVMERVYRNLGCFLLAFLPIFVAGFWIQYLSEIPAFDPFITPPVHVHAVLLFTWIALLVFQPLAIRFRAFSAHRLLGRAFYVVMALIVPFTLTMIWKECRLRKRTPV